MSIMNRIGTAGNMYQRIETHKRVLCVCSGGCLRSPTAAVVLASPPYNFNTRAAGSVEEYAIIPVDEVLIAWADEIVFMEEYHRQEVASKFDVSDVECMVLDILDKYEYRDPWLMKLIKTRYEAIK